MNKNDLEKVVKFLFYGQVGSSSKQICKTFLYGDKDTGRNHPYDPSDFNRCLLCLDVTGIDISIMKTASKQWARLVDEWDTIKNVFLNEVGWNWEKGNSAPITYEFMRSVLNGDNDK